MQRKKWLAILLSILLSICMMMTAQASGLVITASEDVLEETAQFPFLGETDELAVNIRKDTSTKSEKVGRIERGTQLTVLSAELNNSGEVWYAVQLKNGVQGYIRSDLIVRSETQLLETQSNAVNSDAVPNQPSVTKSFKAKPTQAAVNVRTQASTKSGKAGQISRGEILTVLAMVVNSDQENWYEVQLGDGTHGYIRSDLLIETDETESETLTTSPNSTAQKKTTTSGSGQYIGNKKTKKFHRSSCNSLPKESNRVKFSSREKAISSGYDPCKKCYP